jgi:hypothetical protein
VAGIITTHILPTRGAGAPNWTTPSYVQSRVSEMGNTAKPASVHEVSGVLSRMLDLAVRPNRLAVNVAKGVKLPRVVKSKHPHLTLRWVADLAGQLGEREG